MVEGRREGFSAMDEKYLKAIASKGSIREDPVNQLFWAFEGEKRHRDEMIAEIEEENPDLSMYLQAFRRDSPISSLSIDYVVCYYQYHKEAFGPVKVSVEELAKSEDKFRELTAHMSEQETSILRYGRHLQLREKDVEASPKLAAFWDQFDAMIQDIQENYGERWTADTVSPIIKMQEILHESRSIQPQG